MKKNRNLVIIAILFIVSLIYLFSKINFWYVVNFIIYRPMVDVREVTFPTTGETIYLKSYHTSRDHETKVISASGSRFKDPNLDTDFILDSDMHIFYDQKADTLLVYTLTLLDTPRVWPTRVVVHQFDLENPAYMKLYDDSRKPGSSLKYF